MKKKKLFTTGVAVAIGTIALWQLNMDEDSTMIDTDSVFVEDTTIVRRDLNKIPEDTTVYPMPIDWGKSFVNLQDAEIKLQKWIQQHPDYHRGRDLWRDHIHRPLVTLLKGYPETMGYDFPVLKDEEEYFHSVTSKDGRLKAYSWDTGTGGTYRDCDGLCQYSYKGEVRSIYGGIDYLFEGEEKDFPDDYALFNEAQWVYEIYDLQAADGDTYYLIFSYRKFSTLAYADYVELCKITKDGVVRLKGFKRGQKSEETLTVEAELTDLEDCLFDPIYNKKDRLLRMPVATDGRISGEEDYKFDGKCFVRQ